ncbi:erythromycin esterase family protein, partial [Nocardia gipuzkoensis]
ESSHGTEDFYAARASITRWLIVNKGFRAVAIEGDWPDAYRVDRHVRGDDSDPTAEQALAGFERFPGWMWRNTVVRDFVTWLRLYNDQERHAGRNTAGFYGLDLYSMHRSMHRVIAYLERVDPAAADRARRRYACFDRTSENDGQAYGFAAAFGAGPSCQADVVRQLVDLQRNAAEHIRAHDGDAL